METNTQKTETTSITPIVDTAINQNAVKVKAMFDTLDRTALTATFHATKGMRIGNSFAGKPVVNRCNAIAKAESTDTVKMSAIDVLNDFRNPANYEGDKPAEIITNRLSEKSIAFQARSFGRKYGCELSPKDVYKIFMVVSGKLFDAIASNTAA